MRRLTSEQAAERVTQQTKEWGLAREPFEPDGAYFVRVAAHWKDLAQRELVHVVEVFDRDDGTFVFADLDDAIAFEDAVNGDVDTSFGSRCIRREQVVCDHETALKLIESERDDDQEIEDEDDVEEVA